MRRFVIFLILIAMITALSVVSTSAQGQGDDQIDVNVDLECGSIRVSLHSDYARAIKAQVYVGTHGQTEWNLVGDIGNYTTAGAHGNGSRTYYFIVQPANTQISYSIRVYDAVSNRLIEETSRTRDCDGENNNAPPPLAPSTPTASFLASCNPAGSISVQPIGGTAFTVTATQIAQGTAMAIANGQNISITNVSGIAVIGTPANAVLLRASDGYSITIPASSCARTTPVTTTTSTGSSQAATLSCSSIPADAVSTHVVSAGENLFRIGLRYGVHFSRLASYNGIPDATRIFVGQCIAIPPSA